MFFELGAQSFQLEYFSSCRTERFCTEGILQRLKDVSVAEAVDKAHRSGSFILSRSRLCCATSSMVGFVK